MRYLFSLLLCVSFSLLAGQPERPLGKVPDKSQPGNKDTDKLFLRSAPAGASVFLLTVDENGAEHRELLGNTPRQVAFPAEGRVLYHKPGYVSEERHYVLSDYQKEGKKNEFPPVVHLRKGTDVPPPNVTIPKRGYRKVMIPGGHAYIGPNIETDLETENTTVNPEKDR